MDADISVWWLTFVRALLKEVTDAVLLKRRMCLLQLHVLGAYWTTSVERWTRDLCSDERVYWRENDRWKFDCAGHVAAS
jgi:hypothetical protein